MISKRSPPNSVQLDFPKLSTRVSTICPAVMFVWFNISQICSIHGLLQSLRSGSGPLKFPVEGSQNHQLSPAAPTIVLLHGNVAFIPGFASQYWFLESIWEQNHGYLQSLRSGSGPLKFPLEALQYHQLLPVAPRMAVLHGKVAFVPKFATQYWLNESNWEQPWTI